MILDTAIEIKFDSLRPLGEIVEGEKGVYSFKEKPKYRRRKFEFAALVEFLNIPRLSFGSQEERTLARYDFYKRWGFLTNYKDCTELSENEATFDKWHIDLCELNEKRLRGELKTADEIKFTTPSIINWTVRTYETTNLALPIFTPTNLSSALYLSWLFGSRELSGMKTCQRHLDFGLKRGCQVYFIPKPKHKIYCCGNCKKNAHEKLNPRNRRSKK